jgi:hypothetical protein
LTYDPPPTARISLARKLRVAAPERGAYGRKWKQFIDETKSPRKISCNAPTEIIPSNGAPATLRDWVRAERNPAKDPQIGENRRHS